MPGWCNFSRIKIVLTREPNGKKMTTPKTAKTTSKADTLALWVTYVNITLYALCYQLQRPTEPFLVKSLSEEAGDNAADVTKIYGQLQSFFSTLQMIGSPLVGILLDRVGVRNASIIVFLATALSYGILANATDLRMLFWSKVPTVLQAAFLVAQATAATSTGGDTAARAKALGLMTTAYTIGATIGPALGGVLADRFDLYVGAKFAVLGSILSAILSALFLPNNSTAAAAENKSSPEYKKDKKTFLKDLQHSVEIACRPTVWPFLTVKLVGGIVSSMHSTSIPIVLTQKLQFEPSQLGFNMSASMFAVAGFAAVGMAPMARKLGSSGMAKSGLAARAVIAPLFAIILTSQIAEGIGEEEETKKDQTTIMIMIVLTSILHALSSHALATGLTTQTTGSVSGKEQGALLGFEHSLFALARIGGPQVATFFLTGIAGGGFWKLATACASVDLALFLFLFSVVSTPLVPSLSSSSKEEHKEHNG